VVEELRGLYLRDSKPPVIPHSDLGPIIPPLTSHRDCEIFSNAVTLYTLGGQIVTDAYEELHQKYTTAVAQLTKMVIELRLAEITGVPIENEQGEVEVIMSRDVIRKIIHPAEAYLKGLDGSDTE
jgi:hypothetical protein